MPVIKGFDDEKNGEKLKKLVQSSENIDENEIRRMLEESGSFDYTRDIIGNYVNRSKEILDSLEVVDGSLKEYMVSIVNFMSNRDY
jgi:geranylgeranyl pyrophosphate synthase